MLIGTVTGFGAAPAPVFPADIAAQIQNISAGIPSAGGFVPAQPMTAAQEFWLRHKTKIFIGGGLAGGALILWLLARR